MPAFFQKLQAFNKPQRAKYNIFIHHKLRPTPDTVSLSSLTMGMEIVSRASSRGDSQTTHGSIILKDPASLLQKGKSRIRSPCRLACKTVRQPIFGDSCQPGVEGSDCKQIDWRETAWAFTSGCVRLERSHTCWLKAKSLNLAEDRGESVSLDDLLQNTANRTRKGQFQPDQCWNICKSNTTETSYETEWSAVNVNQTKVETALKATLQKHLRDRMERIIWAILSA